MSLYAGTMNSEFNKKHNANLLKARKEQANAEAADKKIKERAQEVEELAAKRIKELKHDKNVSNAQKKAVQDAANALRKASDAADAAAKASRMTRGQRIESGAHLNLGKARGGARLLFGKTRRANKRKGTRRAKFFGLF
jgi:hypothetical protein